VEVYVKTDKTNHAAKRFEANHFKGSIRFRFINVSSDSSEMFS